MPIDSAVAKLLSLNASQTSISLAGGGGMSSASTSKITTHLDDGSKKNYFLKTGSGKDAEIMFAGEHASLKAIHDVRGTPYRAIAIVDEAEVLILTETPSKSFLATDYLDLSSRRTGAASSGMSLAQKMAKLHSTPAPVPEGYDKPMFGFPVTTCCGDTPQPNDYKESWAEFFAENRLRFIVDFGEKRQGRDGKLRDLVTTTIDKVVPRLIGDDYLDGGKGVVPSTVHGDLWSGNASVGRIGGQGAPEDVVFDPSACYGHAEFDFGIMKMFAGFSGFFNEYHKINAKTEPIDEYDDRIKLYELYHHLNHYALFGGGYRSGAVSIMETLIRKYGR